MGANPSQAVRVHPLIASAVIGALLALQSWTLLKITSLAEDVAALKAIHQPPPSSAVAGPVTKP